MAKKVKHPEHVNHERWLVSYADFMTLLFAFFVVMFASSQVDSKKMGRFSESFKQAIEWELFPGAGRGVLSGESGITDSAKKGGESAASILHHGPGASPKPQPARTLEAERMRLEEALLRNLGAGTKEGISLENIRGELVLRLPERLLFERADARLAPEGYMALEIVAAELRDRPVRLRIEGHTDTTAPRAWDYPTNWELSTARAVACVRFLVENDRIEPARISAAGFGAFNPIAPNTTPEGRALNRRVDIAIMADLNQETKETTP
jgi:chemotaxis protein MotB